MPRKIRLPWTELRDLAVVLLDSGVQPEDVVDEIAAAADALVDWTDILPAPVGAIVEAADRPVAVAAARLIVKAVRRKKAA
jgi:hypothetical protein